MLGYALVEPAVIDRSHDPIVVCAWPDAVYEIIHKLETMNGGIFGLVSLQDVGKSSALLAKHTTSSIESMGSPPNQAPSWSSHAVSAGTTMSVRLD